MVTKKLYGGVEGGGTKFVCTIASGPNDIVDEVRFPTTTPDETLARAVAFFKPHAKDLAGIGLAPFGPINVDEISPAYGATLATPKPGWTGANIMQAFRQAVDLPIVVDLDVNAAAFGEYFWVPENYRLNTLVYFTIGTGIGAGVLVNGQLVHGLMHPEAGHMRLPHDWEVDPYAGHCPFHGDCFEGLACGPAITQRWNQPADTLPDDHLAWDLEAGYVAAALANVICLLSPQRIIMGGGVMERELMLPKIRVKVSGLLNGYIGSPAITEANDQYIVHPALGSHAGVMGAIAMIKARVEGK